MEVKKFESPDETRPFADKGYAEVLNFGTGAVGRGVFEPGWRWSKHIKPIAGTERCESSHTSYVLSGRMHVEMDDGEAIDVGPGDVFLVPPGHDAWVVGDERCVVLDFSGMEHYAQPGRERAEAEAESRAPGP
jgi:quercetin dioxygenase-like cupin family protein